MKTRDRLLKWRKRMSRRTEEQTAEIHRKNTLKRMANQNPRTFVGSVFIGRNDPCYCGNTCDIPDGKGGMKPKPVKFKHCCLGKHTTLAAGEITVQQEKSNKKQKAYFDKHRRIPK